MIYETAKISDRTKLFVPQDDMYHVGDFCLVTVPQLVLAMGAQINAGTIIAGQEKVVVGMYSVVGYRCLLLTSSDDPLVALASDYLPKEARVVKTAPIHIGADCFIGSNVILMPGVTVYDGAVIGANSYVDKDVREWTIVYPNKKTKRRNKERKFQSRSIDRQR